MKKNILLFLIIISSKPLILTVEPTSAALITVVKYIVGGAVVGGSGYAGHRYTKTNAKNNIKNVILDLNENHRTNDDQQRKKVLKKYGHVFNAQSNRLIEGYLKLNDTQIPIEYRNIIGLIIGQNLNLQNRRALIEILRGTQQKTTACLHLYRELKEIKGQKIIDHIEDQ